jgi:hypothetical protein
MVAHAEGAQMWACVGQRIRLISNKAAVANRSGVVYAMHIPGAIFDITEGMIQGFIKASAFDVSNLLESSSLTTARPTLGCGSWKTHRNAASSFPFGNVPGVLNASEGYEGWTLIYVKGSGSTQISFTVETACVYGGFLIPSEVPICYAPASYGRVACSRAHGTRGSRAYDDEDASRVGREVHRKLEQSSAMYTPQHVFDGIMDYGSKLLKRAIESFF